MELPDLGYGPRVRRAVLIGGYPALPGELIAAYRELANGLEAGSVPREPATGAMVDAAAGSAMPRSARDEVVAIIARYPLARLVRALRLIAAAGAPELRVAPFKAPALVIHAEGDRAIPLELGRSLAALGENASLEVWEGDSHLLPLYELERTAAAAYA